MNTTTQRQLFHITRTDWETPQALFDELESEFHFTVDVCASPANAKCRRFFGPEQDGLRQDWTGERCWMNPPYGREIGRWCRKAAESGSLVVGLLPARTDTSWWHDWVMPHAKVRFIRGRLRFGRPGLSPAPFPSAIVIWGDR